MTRFVLFLFCVGCLIRPGFAAVGDLDSAFGVDGIAYTGRASNANVSPTAPAIQANGKLVICDGRVLSDLVLDFDVTRFNVDGSLDTTFGNGGTRSIDFGDTSDACTSVAIQADGKIVVVGSSSPDSSPSISKIAVLRLDSYGNPDPSFGSGTGRVLISFVTTPIDFSFATQIRIRSDNKLVIGGGFLAGSQNYDFAAVQLLADGTLDENFGIAGKVSVPFDLAQSGNKADHMQAMAIDGSGRILLGGSISANAENTYDFGVVRLLANGSVDTAFGTNGRSVVPFNVGLSGDDRFLGMSMQRDGNILLVGSADTSPIPSHRNYDAAVARLLPDGSVDMTFGNNGPSTFPIGISPGSDGIRSAFEQLDGRFFLVGFAADSGSNPKPAAARMYSNGLLDESLGTSGTRTYSAAVGPSMGGFIGLVESSGNLAISGSAGNFVNDNQSFLVRINIDAIFADSFE